MILFFFVLSFFMLIFWFFFRRVCRDFWIDNEQNHFHGDWQVLMLLEFLSNISLRITVLYLHL